MIGHGTTLSGATTTLGKLTNINWDGVTISSVDTTEYDSTGKAVTSAPGMKDYGTITASMNFDKAQITAINTAIDTDDEEVWTFDTPDGSSFVGSGYFTSMNVDTPLRENISINVSIKLTGPLVYTAAA